MPDPGQLLARCTLVGGLQNAAYTDGGPAALWGAASALGGWPGSLC